MRFAGFFHLIPCLFALLAAPPVLARDVRIIDGDTLEVDGVVFRLHGIDAPEAGQHCQLAHTTKWQCGNAATAFLAELVGSGIPECDNRGMDDYDRVLSVCSLDGVDLNRAMVASGFAWAFRRYSEDYAVDEDIAAAAHLGIWQHPTQTAWDFRDDRWTVAVQVSPEGCPIKGNISANGRIYHAPWSPWYDRTRISVEKGERWFCTERDALDAGWRAPVWGG